MTRFTTCALLITLAAGFGCESSHPHSDRLEVRAADVEAHPGWTETSRFIGGSKVWMAPKAAVDTSMISEARPAVDHHGNSVVVVRLTPDGALALSELTARQETRPLAVLIEGDVVATPLVLTKLDEEFVISRAGWSREDAEAFARSVGRDS